MARTLAPGSPALDAHPKNVYLPERAVLPALNAWIGDAFDPKNRDQTVAALVADQHRRAGDTSAHQGIKKRLADAEMRLRRLREAIEAGAHPEALIDSINDAQAQRAAARAELDAVGPTPDLMSDAEVYAAGRAQRHQNRPEQGEPRPLAEDLRRCAP